MERHWGRDFFSFFFWPHGAACGILVPRPGMERVPPALEVWSLNHWSTREVPGAGILTLVLYSQPPEELNVNLRARLLKPQTPTHVICRTGRFY